MFATLVKPTISKIVLAAGVLAVTIFALPRPASADTQSTAAIVAAAALIVGAIAYDSSGRPYYDRDGRRWYVSRDTADYYRMHFRNRNPWYGSDRNGQYGGYGQYGQYGQYGNRNGWNGQYGNRNGWNGQYGQNDRYGRSQRGNRPPSDRRGNGPGR
jgi:hypothetical protein